MTSICRRDPPLPLSANSPCWRSIYCRELFGRSTRSIYSSDEPTVVARRPGGSVLPLLLHVLWCSATETLRKRCIPCWCVIFCRVRVWPQVRAQHLFTPFELTAMCTAISDSELRNRTAIMVLLRVAVLEHGTVYRKLKQQSEDVFL
jgi:hypothetical protein